MNTSFDTECETSSARPLNQITDDLNNISLKVKTNVNPLAPMVSTTFVSNGCTQLEETPLVSNATKTTINGFNGCIESIASNHSNRSTGNGSNAYSNNSCNLSDISSTNSSHSGVQSLQTSPFPRLSGETVLHTGTTTEGQLIVTNFRLLMSYNSPKDSLPISLSIGLIESIELRELYYLYVYSKHVRSFIFSFGTADDCSLWFKRLTDVCSAESKLEHLFCFKYFSSNKSDRMGFGSVDKQIRNCFETVEKEFKRMAFDENVWRISDVNKEFKLCSSYPRYLVVPKSFHFKDLESVANFRYSRRIPTVVWRHRKNGCIIARSSQPEVGWLGWRNNQDEHLLHIMAISCNSAESENKKLLVLDARSYTAAVANRAKGGGCECPEYYLSSEVQFMSLANIHSIRKSYHSLRYICESPADQFNWLTLLDNTKWLHNISGLIKSALIVVNAIDLEERPVLVHCSDGWDRTPQIVALAELMLDPFYRTIDGFRVLIEREWIQFGHKFADRCGLGSSSEDTNERCPVFLQWLDCVHQLVRQYPCSFEFNLNFLIKLIQHTYSSLFGTFICNNMRERLDFQIYERTYSVWSYFQSRRQQFINYIYLHNEQVLRPSCKAKDIVFWSDVYMPLSSSVCAVNHHILNPENVVKNSISAETSDSMSFVNGITKEEIIESKPNSELNESNNETNETESDMDTIASDKHHSLSKTRSCDNLALDDTYSFVSGDSQPFMKTRHCSDPNLFGSQICLEQNDCERGKSAVLEYIRDLQSNGLSVNQDVSDRDSNHLPSSRVSEDGLIEDTEPGMSAHFSMLSTETLMNGNSSYMENMPSRPSCCETHNSLLSTLLTASTSTTELSNSCVASADLSVPFDKLYHSIYNQKKKAVPQTSSSAFQRQSSNENNNSCNGYAKHTRTPSSGCPATPNDEQTFDPFPFEGVFNQEVFDIDGHVLLSDKVLIRLQQIVGQNKSEIDYLRRELYLARLALCQQLKYCNGINDETNNCFTNTSHSFEYLTESPSLDSWVDVMPSLAPIGINQNRNGFTMNGKCDKSDLFSQSSAEQNYSACDDSLDSNGMALNHL